MANQSESLRLADQPVAIKTQTSRGAVSGGSMNHETAETGVAALNASFEDSQSGIKLMPIACEQLSEAEKQSVNECKAFDKYEVDYGLSDSEESVNLNDVVSHILKDKACDDGNRQKQRRLRLTADQIAILEAEFQKNANWTSKDMAKLSTRLAVEKSKIYKWNWDRKRKELASQGATDHAATSIDE